MSVSHSQRGTRWASRAVPEPSARRSARRHAPTAPRGPTRRWRASRRAMIAPSTRLRQVRGPRHAAARLALSATTSTVFACSALSEPWPQRASAKRVLRALTIRYWARPRAWAAMGSSRTASPASTSAPLGCITATESVCRARRHTNKSFTTYAPNAHRRRT